MYSVGPHIGIAPPEGLLYDLASANGVYDGMPSSQLEFARTLLKSPIIIAPEDRFSSHGRPAVLQPDLLLLPVVRWMDVSDTDDVFYFCANQTVFQYERRDPVFLDGYSRLGTCPDSDQALLQFVRDGTIFYLLSSGTWGGHLSGKIYKFESDSGTWTTLADNVDGQPEIGQRYDYTTSDDYISDNRRNFVLHQGYLYFVFGNNTTGTERTGIKRIDLSDNSIEIVYSQGITSDFGWNFVIEGTKLYAFICRRVSYETEFFIHRMDLDGDNREIIFEESWSGIFYPTLASDIVVHGSDFYFVLNYSFRTVGQGPADLCRLPIVGGDVDDRIQLRRYPDMFFGPRSLTVYKERVYFLEGQSYATLGNHLDDLAYPTFEEAGHLGSVTSDSMDVSDHGPVWRSYRDPNGTGLGMHTSFPSNLLYDASSDVLHLICGYGLFVDVPVDVDEDLGSVASVRSDEILDFNNWVWIQYGEKLSTKIPILETNGKVVWGLMEDIAKTVNWELGFDVFTDEVADHISANSGVAAAFDTSRSYLFFRGRQGSGDPRALDDSLLVDTQEQTETNFIFNHIMMRYGEGIFSAKDTDLIEKEGSRALVLDVNLLSNHDAPWAEVVAGEYLEVLKTPQTKLMLTTKFGPHFAVGDLIFCQSEWGRVA